MPVPLLVPLASVVGGRLATWLAWLGVGSIINYVQELGVTEAIYGWIADAAGHYAGLSLDRNDPLSDASLAGAVSQKLGVNIRSLKDQAKIREDLDIWAAALVSERSGYLVTSVSDVAVLRVDLQRVAAAVLTEKLNLPVGVFPDDGGEINPVVVRERLLAWAKAELLSGVAQEVGISVDEIYQMGDIEAVAAEMNSRLSGMASDFEVPGRKMAMLIANNMASKAITDYQRVAVGGSKKARRREQIRQAQAKFRSVHGNRQQYVPLGMSATVG